MASGDYAIEPLGVRTWDAFAAMYEEAGFVHIRPKGLKNTVMRRTVEPA